MKPQENCKLVSANKSPGRCVGQGDRNETVGVGFDSRRVVRWSWHWSVWQPCSRKLPIPVKPEGFAIHSHSLWLKTMLGEHEGRWAAAIDGKTCCQGLAADGSPVQMLNVFLQQAKVTLDQWSIGGDKTNEPGSFKNHLSELLAAYPALQLFTGDAIYAQRPLLELLKVEGCDYLFQIKANQPDVLDALTTCFADVTESRPAHQTTEKRGSISKPAGCGSTWTTPRISASV